MSCTTRTTRTHRTTRTTRRAAVGVALTVLAGAVTATSLGTPATAAPAVAAGTSGSIVYVRSNNIWISRGNGTHARRLTSIGTQARPFHSPSESDGGIVAAAYGTRIVRMTQTGRILNTIDPPKLYDTAGEALDGAVNDVSISPNGATIAYSFVRYTCPIGADCMTRYATGYTSATHLTRAGRPTYYRAPSWVTNSRTLETGGYGSQVVLHDLGSAPRHWFDDHDYTFPSTDLSDGEVSRDAHWVAEVRGFKQTASIIWYLVSGNVRAGAPPAVPDYTCYTNGDAAHASPTFSPDSTALAWASSDGIWVKRSIDDCSGVAPRLLIRGGSAPDWSPAALR